MDSILGGISNLRVDTVLSAVDKYVPGAQNKIKNLADKAKAYVNNVSELEMKVLEATNHEPWGPHGSIMQEITQHSFNSEGFYQIMGVVDQRLSEGPDNWRLVYKTLLLLEYMLKHGPMSVAEALGSYSRISLLEKLRDKFEYKDPTGHDQGINVRQRAGAVVVLLNDRDKLAEEREKAAKNKSKYTGVSSSSMRYGGFSGGSSSSYDNSSSSAPGYNRSSSSSTYGSGGFRNSTSSSSSTAAEAADPIEATKQRIARLKEQGAIAGADGTSTTGAGDGSSSVGPGLEDPMSPGRKPKKLSDIKINPAISAMFAKGGLAPPASAGSTGGTTRATAGSTGGTASGIDLLGDLDVRAPAASSSTAAAADEWDSFSSAPVVGGAAAAAAPAVVAAGAGGVAADDWAAFDSAPAPVANIQKVRGPLDINALLGPIPSTAPAASKGSTPLSLDDFCNAPAVQRPPAAGATSNSSSVAVSAPAAAAAADPFGPFVTSPTSTGTDPFASSGFSSFTSAAPAAAAAAAAAASFSAGAAGGAGDPFATSGAVHMMAQATKQHSSTGPKLGPETAKAKDPFADLALI